MFAISSPLLIIALHCQKKVFLHASVMENREVKRNREGCGRRHNWIIVWKMKIGGWIRSNLQPRDLEKRRSQSVSGLVSGLEPLFR